jgi:Domain of unknown function (DUF5666)
VIQEPVQLTPTSGAPSGARRSSAIKIGLVILAIILLAIPVAFAVAANTPTTSTHAILGAGASPSPDATGKPDGGKAQEPKRDLGALRGPGRGPITIRAISDSQISLATDDGWSRTITATTTTVITKGGVTIDVGALHVGDEIGFRQTRNADGSYSITAITVVTPKAAGEVTKVDGNEITIKQRGDATKVITVTGSTVYKLGDAAGSKSDVKVGSSITAAGTVSGDTFTALSVNIKLARAGGEVSKVDGNAITVKLRGDTTRVITVTGSTEYKLGKATGAKSDVKVGTRIDAVGVLDGSTFTASSVRIQLAHADGSVKSKTTDSITISNRDGSTTVIHVTAATTYKVRGKASASLADIAVDDLLIAEGTRRADGSLDAVSVGAGQVKGFKLPKVPAKAPASSAVPG